MSMQRTPARNPLARVFAEHFAEGEVAEVERVAPSMLRIRIASPELDRLSWEPGRHVRVQINDPLSLYGIVRPKETLRTYTVWEFSAEDRAFDVLVHLYAPEGEGGIGLAWARAAEVGDRVVFWGPRGDFAVRPEAGHHLFVGEETATAAFWPMVRALGGGAEVRAVLESADGRDEPPFPEGHSVVRVHRGGAPAASSRTLVDALAGVDLPDAPGAAYVAGEARTCQMVRHHLVSVRGWPREDVRTVPFWTPGKRGLH
ncbi:siderophore-interacting protein [Nocardiopsis sp. CNT-189]|uniref:siderophore-interacting protein n=1 Tax=Nocardiopsis oceanisediminis TaxID=2816862 RepID=UPI003B2C65B2